MITLLAPESKNMYSGGYLYNEKVAAAADPERLRYRILPLPLPEPSNLHDRGVPDDSSLLLDSLFFSFPEWVMKLKNSRKSPTSFLIHYLPSLDPTLENEAIESLRLLEFNCIRTADRIITTSRYMRKQVDAFFGGLTPVKTAHPGWDPPDDSEYRRREGRYGLGGLTWPAGRMKLLTIANWTKAKNHRFLLHVLKAIEHEAWEWRIFGAKSSHGSLENVFLQNARQLKLRDRITIGPLLQPVQVRREMLTADIFLLPSIFESYGMAAAEALCAGLPMIANRTGGLPEVIGASEAAILCTPGNTAEWINALKDLIRSPIKRDRLHQAALNRAYTMPGWKDTAEVLCTFLETK